LAVSDIESHLQLARQLMNIGKPYEVEGLGIFVMQRDGSVVLNAGHYAVPFADNAGQPARLKERTEQQEKTEAEASGGSLGTGVRKALIAIVIIAALGIAGWFIWSKMVNEKPSEVIDTIPAADTTQQNTIVPIQDSLVQQAPAIDTIPSWRAYFRTFSGKDRLNSMQRIYAKSNPAIETTDSTTFRMYIVIQSPVADTAFKSDSLSKVFLRPITLEKINP